MNIEKPIPSVARYRPLEGLLFLSAAILAVAPAASAQPLKSAENPGGRAPVEETVANVAPLKVNTSGDTGYLSKNTLSVNRVNTNIMEAPQTVQIVNSQLLSDMHGYPGNYLPAALFVLRAASPGAASIPAQDQYIWGFRAPSAC